MAYARVDAPDYDDQCQPDQGNVPQRKAGKVDETRQQGGIEQHGLHVPEHQQQPGAVVAPEMGLVCSAACGRRGTWRETPEPDAGPDEVRGAEPLQQGEQLAERSRRRGHAGGRQREEQQVARDHARIDRERGSNAIGDGTRNDGGHGRPGSECRHRDRRGQGEVDARRHRWVAGSAAGRTTANPCGGSRRKAPGPRTAWPAGPAGIPSACRVPA